MSTIVFVNMNFHQFRATTAEPPHREALQAHDERWIERRAKLFEAGEYPDKDLTVTSEQLAALCQNFGEPVPVLIEHASSPLELGFLTSVEAIGNELFGQVSLTPEANALIERSGARSLSIGIAPDLSRIVEVSLVENPRVPSAKLFAGSLQFFGSLSDSEAGWKERFHALQESLIVRAAEEAADRFVREGRLLPCQRPLASALLAHEEAVRFGTGMRPVRDLLLEMLSLQPPHSLFKEHAPASTEDHSAVLMMPEEAEFYRKHFPGVELSEIAKRR